MRSACGFPKQKKTLSRVEGGYIVALKSTNDMDTWSTVGIALMLKDNHLSYPQIFYENGEYWMLPQVSNAGGMHLWRTNAHHFPLGWEYVHQIGNPKELYVDASYYKKGQHEHYLFTSYKAIVTGDHAVHVWYSASLLGPWKEHPHSPIAGATKRLSASQSKDTETLKKARRPGGRPFVLNKILYVPCQTSEDGYGSGLAALVITKLSFVALEQLVEASILTKSAKDEWKSDGAHHFVVNEVDNVHLGQTYRYSIAVDGKGHLKDPTVQLGVYHREEGEGKTGK